MTLTKAQHAVLLACLRLHSSSSPVQARYIRQITKTSHKATLDALIALCGLGHLSKVITNGPIHYRIERDLAGSPIDRGARKTTTVTKCPPCYAEGFGFGSPTSFSDRPSNCLGSH